MAYGQAARDRAFLGRLGLAVIACTTALTLSFVGVVALATGGATGIDERLPFYALGMAGLFVAAIVGLEGRRRDARTVLVGACAVAVAGAVLLGLGGEGFVYAMRNPGEALAAQRFLYLVAAGLMATGLGYWGSHHWRDVTRSLGP